MGFLRSLRSALAVAFRRRRFEDGVADELKFHIDAYAEDLVQSGVAPAEARRRARLELGGTEALKEELRAARGQRLFDELWQDSRYALRRLRHARVPAVVAVLALGVGVNLAVFSVIYASIFRPLPHPEPDRLVSISSRHIKSGREHLTAPLDFFDFERRTTSFARLAAYYPPGFTLTGGEQAERVSGARASSGIFEVFGVQPALGRGFLPAEPLEVEIVGVVGDVRELALRLPPGPGIYAPNTQQPWLRHETRDLVIRSTADTAAIAPAIHAVIRDLEPDIPRSPVQRMEDVVGGALARPGFYATAVASFAAVAVLLAGFGIYGTVTSAVAERRRELGVRLALGASRRDVLVRAAGCGLTPTLLGLAAGVPLALAGGRIVREQLYGIGPADWPTILLVLGIMGAVALAAALGPALRATRIDPVLVLKHEAGG